MLRFALLAGALPWAAAGRAEEASAESSTAPACDDDVALLQQSLVISQNLLAREAEAAKANHSVRARARHAANGTAAVNVFYGNSACKCIGIDQTEGEALATISGKTVPYPSDVGAHCGDWDFGTHPLCKGSSPPEWCTKKWCYIDPCQCDISAIPKTMSYFPSALYKNKPVFWSYETCGNADIYTEDNYADACVNQKSQSACNALGSKCSWSLSKGCVGAALSGTQCDLVRQNDETVWGDDECECIGISGVDGEIDVLFGNSLVEYPVSVGSTCEAWDENLNPDCVGDGEKPSWCSQKWCYVDPCLCSSTTPVVSEMLPDARFRGMTLYYSYATCGAIDTFTAEENEDACVNQQTPQDCEALSKCMWSFMGNDIGYVCRGIEVATFCAQTISTEQSGAPLPGGPTAALALAVAGILARRGA